MIWLTWKQQRMEGLIAAGLLAALTAFLILTGLNIHSTYSSLGLSACMGPSPNQNCSQVVNTFQQEFMSLTSLLDWLNFVPLIIGLLLSAPLALDLEQGTYRLAWTQSITRNRWILTRLVLVVLGAACAGLIFDMAMTWWRIPFDHIDGSFDAFDFEGLVPVVYAVYAAALGLVFGTVIRRTVVAAAATLAVYLATRLSLIGIARPHYMSPVRSLSQFRPGGSAGPTRGDWVLSSGLTGPRGHNLSSGAIIRMCNPLSMQGSKVSLTHCLHVHHVTSFTLFQPGSRFWAFQGIESGIFGAGSLLCLGITVWFVRTRLR